MLWLASAAVALALPPAAAAVDLKCQWYCDSVGNRVLLHPRSFADRAVCPGDKDCPNGLFSIRGQLNSPENAIGPPDREPGVRGDQTIYTLGCRRSATWEFTDNLIVDVPGPDIFVFEIGQDEPTIVELSNDGVNWLRVGCTEGGRSSIDIGGHVAPNETFRLVRLTDLGRHCGSKRYAGADIDAIATFAYSWTHVADDTTAVYFDTGRSELTENGRAALQRLFADKSLASYRLQVIGHTDDVGSDVSNVALSERRASSVADFLVSLGAADADNIVTIGEGESFPKEPNDTEAGRARNRRVEITFFPEAACPERDYPQPPICQSSKQRRLHQQRSDDQR